MVREDAVIDPGGARLEVHVFGVHFQARELHALGQVGGADVIVTRRHEVRLQEGGVSGAGALGQQAAPAQDLGVRLRPLPLLAICLQVAVLPCVALLVERLVKLLHAGPCALGNQNGLAVGGTGDCARCAQT